jgi:Uncharacterized protein conserved in bacteria (DUF2252)
MLLYVSRWFVIQSYDDPVLSYSANKCAAYPAAPFAATHPTIASAIQIPLQACGDCHLMNFGAFATPEQNILFDINDFDEIYRASISRRISSA